MSDSCFSELLLVVGTMLPEGNCLPSPYSEAKKILSSLGMEYEKIHVCPNDCLLYRGEINEDETSCHICQASRWKKNKNGDEIEGIPAKLVGNIVKGYNGCLVCVDQTKATRLPNYRKTGVMRHRRWLTRDHPYRKQKAAFDNTIEKGSAPIHLTWEEVFQRVQYLQDHVYGKTQRKPGRKKGDPRPVLKKLSIFFQVEYWKFLPVRHILDVMHIEKNICEALIGTLLNIPKKTKDKEYVRLDMDAMGIRLNVRPETAWKKEKLPLAFWNLTHSEKNYLLIIFGNELPDGFCSNIRSLIVSNLLDGEEVPQHIRWVADGPKNDVPTFSGYKVHGVTFSTKSHDDAHHVPHSGVFVDAHTMVMQGTDKNIQHTSHTYYGVIKFIWELDYNSFRIPLFLYKWVDMNRGIKVNELGYTLVNLNRPGFFNDPFVLATHVKQVCYIDDPLEKLYSVVLKFPERKHYDDSEDENEGSVEVELGSEFFLCPTYQMMILMMMLVTSGM
ncbi:uncharacterized protein LOC141709409 [Apium graveolens]|uniref:uncharacterized protein LOC141709409 n=1 Tax=Apium graveolens TaxID=4045 RepID=UPI003D7B804E